MIFNIDIDNTVNDFIQTFIVYINRLSGRNIQYDDITFYDLTNLGYDRKTLETMFFKNNQFFHSMKPLEKSQDTINGLIDAGHDVRFVTAIDYEVIQARLDFVHNYFPKINTSKSLIVTNDKKSIFGDFVIDDLPSNLNNINRNCKYILFKQPWNIDNYDTIQKLPYNKTNTSCCSNWHDIYNLFKAFGLFNKEE